MTDQPTAVEHPKALRRPPRGQIRATTIDKTMSSRLPSNPAWSAVAALQTPIICDLRTHARSAARSATSSPSRFAGDTIARFIALVTKRLGGKTPESIRPSLLARYGWKPIHCRQFRSPSNSNNMKSLRCDAAAQPKTKSQNEASGILEQIWTQEAAAKQWQTLRQRRSLIRGGRSRYDSRPS
jgi:hypothetical protein